MDSAKCFFALVDLESLASNPPILDQNRVFHSDSEVGVSFQPLSDILKRMNSSNPHPCISCGACCASFRVAFYWREAEKGSAFEVPTHLTVDLDANTRCMKGTESKHKPCCSSLRGHIGERAWCSIYESRPSPCREFKASYENGFQNIRCDDARAKHGLKPLNKRDWKRYHEHEI